MGGDYPAPVGRFRLVGLPSAYTDLHSELTAATGSEHPALCLLCGAVLDGDGKGRCTAHATKCNLGCGMFFLLQECTLVLMHRRRACYLPSPYVDDHGERHGQFRGRPLYLDRRRLDLLRALAANHEIPLKVVHNRSTSRQVIISGYY